MRRAKQRFGGGRIAGLPVKRAVARNIVPQLYRPRHQRRATVRYRRQRFVVDFEMLRRIPRLRCGFGDHAGYRIADMAHPFTLQGMALRFMAIAAVAALQGRQTRQGTDSRIREIGVGEDGQNARQRARRRRVDARDARMCVRGTRDECIRLLHRWSRLRLTAS